MINMVHNQQLFVVYICRFLEVSWKVEEIELVIHPLHIHSIQYFVYFISQKGTKPSKHKYVTYYLYTRIVYIETFESLSQTKQVSILSLWKSDWRRSDLFGFDLSKFNYHGYKKNYYLNSNPW